jgi:hypothetical protein
MSQILNFKFNWADYLTPCPFKKDIMIGEYECSVCPYHKGFKITQSIDTNAKDENDVVSYKRYFEVGTGIVECSAESENIETYIKNKED